MAGNSQKQGYCDNEGPPAEQEFPSLVEHRFVQQPEALRKHDFSEMNEKLRVFLDKLVLDYKKQQ